MMGKPIKTIESGKFVVYRAQDRTIIYTRKHTLRVLLVESGDRKKGGVCKPVWKSHGGERAWVGQSTFKGSSVHVYRCLHSHITNTYRLHGQAVHVHRLHRM